MPKIEQASQDDKKNVTVAAQAVVEPNNATKVEVKSLDAP